MYFISRMYIILSCMVEFLWYGWCPEQMKILIAVALNLKGTGGILFIFGNSFGALLLVCIQIFSNKLNFIFFWHFFFLVLTIYFGCSSCISLLLLLSTMIFTIMRARTKNLLNFSSNLHRSETWLFLKTLFPIQYSQMHFYIFSLNII